MHLLCTLSRHLAAPVTLENQGFLFSKCRRCSHDLVSSPSGPPSWRAVPEGFRVAWRATDLSVFERTSLSRQAWRRVRRDVATTRDVTHLVATVIGWRATDGARKLKAKAEDAYRSSKGLLRLPERKADTCVVIVNLTPDALGVLLRGRTADANA